jgi:UDP-N-acetyl-D-mannosaminuronic acid dehydrogenase
MNNFPGTTTDTPKSICLIGLGYVGLTLALTLSRVGFKVAGVEKNPEILECLKNGKAHFYEPNIEDYLRDVLSSGNFDVFSEIPEGEQFDYFVITVGTPLNEFNQPRMDMIEAAAREIRQHLTPGVTVILRSTVKLGTTNAIVKPVLDEAEVEYHLAFCPERTTEGSALKELRFLPQIVSGVNEASLESAAKLFSYVTPIVLRVSSVETAELIKMVDNTQRDLYFAYANEVASICDELGVSAREVIDAGNFHYPRNNLAKPGPVGGPCLSKDSYLLNESLPGNSKLAEITMTARHVNETQISRAVHYMASQLKTMQNTVKKVSILGLAFKGIPETDDLRGSTAISLLRHLRESFPQAQLYAFDPVVSQQKIIELGAIPLSRKEEAFDGANLVVIHNNHAEFSKLSLPVMAQNMSNNSIIYDFWNLHPEIYRVMPEGVSYIALGEHLRQTQKMPSGRA